VDVQDQLAKIIRTVTEAKAVPMSASCLVNRTELLEALDALRVAIPADLDQADALLADRDAVLEQGRTEAQQLLSDAVAEREQLMGQEALVATARAQAAGVTAAAGAEAQRLLTDADDYVDRKLGEFEVVLGQLAAQVRGGRQRLAARHEHVSSQGAQGVPGHEAWGQGAPDG